MSENLSSFLASMESQWKERSKASKERPSFENLPDGRYLTKVADGRVEESQASGRPQTCLEFVVVSGDQEGEIIRHYTGLNQETSLEFLARDIAAFGYDPEEVRFSQLPALLEEIAGRESYVKVRLRTKGEFQNCYIEQVMPEGWQPETVAGVVPKAEGAKPAKAKTEKAAVKAPEPEPEPVEEVSDEAKPGMRVKFQKGSKELEGVILAINEEDQELDIESDGKTYSVPQDKVLGIIPEGTDS